MEYQIDSSSYKQGFKVHVGSLPAKATVKSVKRFFSGFGTVLRVEMNSRRREKKQEALNLGHCLVVFTELASAQTVCDQENIFFGNRKLVCSKYRTAASLKRKNYESNSRRLILKNFPLTTSQQQLEAHLKPFGEIVSAFFFNNPDNPSSTAKTASAQFKSTEAATNLLSMKYIYQNGRKIKIEQYQHKKKDQPEVRESDLSKYEEFLGQGVHQKAVDSPPLMSNHSSNSTTQNTLGSKVILQNSLKPSIKVLINGQEQGLDMIPDNPIIRTPPKPFSTYQRGLYKLSSGIKDCRCNCRPFRSSNTPFHVKPTKRLYFNTSSLRGTMKPKIPPPDCISSSFTPQDRFCEYAQNSHEFNIRLNISSQNPTRPGVTVLHLPKSSLSQTCPVDSNKMGRNYITPRRTESTLSSGPFLSGEFVIGHHNKDF